MPMTAAAVGLPEQKNVRICSALPSAHRASRVRIAKCMGNQTDDLLVQNTKDILSKRYFFRNPMGLSRTFPQSLRNTITTSVFFASSYPQNKTKSLLATTSEHTERYAWIEAESLKEWCTSVVTAEYSHLKRLRRDVLPKAAHKPTPSLASPSRPAASPSYLAETLSTAITRVA